eukprot:TRINITY_DN2859_c0_g2_i1.p1 TRINITY_DN2859_c0_g2~~TRINITY_DN2859_c0_g2_i1.p1  ORF type:complete len:174 (+),score=62.37 TRINITY_DN2859_c0_g2_i1:425-946(+)
MAGKQPNDTEADALMSNLEDGIGSLEDMLKPFLQRPYDQMIDEMDAVTVAKMNVMFAYALNSLYFAFLRTRGQNPNEHPVKKELDRIKEYYQKVKDTSEKNSVPQMKLNVDAANRFINSALKETQPNREEVTESVKENKKEKVSTESKGNKKKSKSVSQKETLESSNKKKQKK